MQCFLAHDVNEYVLAVLYHAPAVPANQENTVFQHSAAGPTAPLQNGCLQDVPVVPFRVVALHQHDIKMGKTWPTKADIMRTAT